MHTVLSIQSHVAFGHAGNSAAVFPLQRQGVDVIDVLTVNFSNHTGYGAWRGPHIPPADVAAVVTGVRERGAMKRCDAILTGYMGAREMGEVILDAVVQVKEENPSAIWCCDPVMGDVGRGFYVMEGIPQFFRDHVISKADVLTPNQFELDYLSGKGTTTTLAEVLDAVEVLRERGPRTVLVTSVITTDTDPNNITMLVVGDDGRFLVTTPRLATTFTGSGDLTAATFLTHLLDTGSIKTALENTAARVHAILKHTEESGNQELQLVAAQDYLITPPQKFTAEQVPTVVV